MINTIIFDFGNVFIDLNIEQSHKQFSDLNFDVTNEEFCSLNHQFEKGEIKEEHFMQGFQKLIPHAEMETIRESWNSILGEFPLYRLEFLQMLSEKYRLFLLTNTDAIHIDRFENNVGASFFSDFYQCFEKVYYSFEMGMRKPDPEIFNYIIKKHELSPKRTLFVDDRKDNCDAAESVGLNVWHLQVGEEDVVDLFEKKIL